MRWMVGVSAALLAVTAALPSAARGEAVAFQAGAAHAGNAGDVGLRLPLRRAWQVRLGGRITYPVAAGGTVYVGHLRPHDPAEVVALSISTGSIRWRRDVGQGIGGLALGGGRLIVTRYPIESEYAPHGVLALDAADGRVIWDVPAGGDRPPLVHDGVVLVGSAAVTALRLPDGAILWQHSLATSADGLAAAGDAVFSMAGGCEGTARLRFSDGLGSWPLRDTCALSATTTWTPVVHRGRIYTDLGPTNSLQRRIVLDAATGAIADRVRYDVPPAFSGGIGVFGTRAIGPNAPGLTFTARAMGSGKRVWRFTGDGYLDSAPLIANGVVFSGSGSGRVYGISLRSGRRVFRADAGRPVPAPKGGLWGLAAAGRTLFVPALDRLVAYR
jgi:outer membrane protein assembly factor BamB